MTFTKPPWLFTIWITVERPKPVPLPSSFVVKNDKFLGQINEIEWPPSRFEWPPLTTRLLDYLNQFGGFGQHAHATET